MSSASLLLQLLQPAVYLELAGLPLRFRVVRGFFVFFPRAHLLSCLPSAAASAECACAWFTENPSKGPQKERRSTGKTFDTVTSDPSWPHGHRSLLSARHPQTREGGRGGYWLNQEGKRPGMLVRNDARRSPLCAHEHTHPPFLLWVILHELKSRAPGGNSLKSAASSASEAMIP